MEVNLIYSRYVTAYRCVVLLLVAKVFRVQVVNEYTARMPEWVRSLITQLPTARYTDIRHRMSVTQAFATKIVNEKITQVQKDALISNDSLGLMSEY
jgi:hypothetical protein